LQAKASITTSPHDVDRDIPGPAPDFDALAKLFVLRRDGGHSDCSGARSSIQSRTCQPCSAASCRASRQQTPASP
jgi:hypothetical protein